MDMGKNFEYKNGDMSDGYHTFGELYEHRNNLFIALVISSRYKSYYKKDHFDGYDCLYLATPNGQISYHVPSSLRELYKDKAIEVDDKYLYDGHTSIDVINRLKSIKEQGCA